MRRRVREGDVFGLLTVVDVFDPGSLPDIDDHDFGVWCRVRCACGPAVPHSFARAHPRAPAELRLPARASVGGVTPAELQDRCAALEAKLLELERRDVRRARRVCDRCGQLFDSKALQMAATPPPPPPPAPKKPAPVEEQKRTDRFELVELE